MSQTMLLLSAQEVSDIIENAVQRGINNALSAREAGRSNDKLTKVEVCEQYHIHRSTLYRWEKAGFLVPHKMDGRKPYYLREEVEKVL